MTPAPTDKRHQLSTPSLARTTDARNAARPTPQSKEVHPKAQRLQRRKEKNLARKTRNYELATRRSAIGVLLQTLAPGCGNLFVSVALVVATAGLAVEPGDRDERHSWCKRRW